MKIIYLGITMGLIHKKTPEIAKKILNKGEVKELENGVRYIVVFEE